MRLMILEDNSERRTAMLDHVADCLPMFAVAFFDSSVAMIEAIERTGLVDVALISLDNDLDPLGFVNGKPIDAGDGLSVARYLAGIVSQSDPERYRKPPVIVHSTNQIAASQIILCLSDAGWDVTQVVPYDAEVWIGETWIRQVRRKLIASVTERKEPVVPG